MSEVIRPRIQRVVSVADRELARLAKDGAGLATSQSVPLPTPASATSWPLGRVSSRLPREWSLEVVPAQGRSVSSVSWGDVFATSGHAAARRETYVGRVGARGLRAQLYGAHVSLRLELPASFAPAGLTSARWSGVLTPGRSVPQWSLSQGQTVDLATTETVVPIPDFVTLLRTQRLDTTGAGVQVNLRMRWLDAAGAVIGVWSYTTATTASGSEVVVPPQAVSVGVANTAATGGVQVWSLRWE